MSARRIAYTTAAQIVGKFVGFFISSFTLVILSAHLGTSGMGYYNTITAYLAFFMIIADLGISTVMIREIAQNPQRREEISGDFLGLRTIYGFVVMAAAPLVAYLVPQYRGIVAAGSIVAAVGQFLLLINQAYVAILQANTRLDLAVYAEIGNRLLTLVLIIWGAHRYSSNLEQFLIFVLWTIAAGSLLNLLLCAVCAHRFWPARPRFNPSRWWQMTLLVLPMGLFNFLGMIHFRSDTVVLSLIKGTHDVGVYGFAYKIAEILLSIPQMFLGAIFPRLSVLFKENMDEFRVYAQKSFTALAFLTFPMIAAIYGLAPYMTTLLSRQSLGDGETAGKLLQILCLAMFCWYFGNLYQNLLLVGSNYKGLSRNMAFAAVLNLTLNFAFIPHFTYYAAAWTTVASELLMLALTVAYVRRVTGFRAVPSGFVPIVAGAVALLAAIFVIRQLVVPDISLYASASRPTQILDLLAMASAGGAAYLAVMLAAGKRSPLYFFISLLKKADV